MGDHTTKREVNHMFGLDLQQIPGADRGVDTAFDVARQIMQRAQAAAGFPVA